MYTNIHQDNMQRFGVRQVRHKYLFKKNPSIHKLRFLNSKHQNHLKSLSPKHPPSPLSAKHSQISRKRQQAVGESHMWSKDFFPHARSIHGMTGYQVSRSRKPILGEFCCFPLLFSFSSHHHLTHHTHIFKNNTYFLFHSFCRRPGAA